YLTTVLLTSRGMISLIAWHKLGRGGWGARGWAIAASAFAIVAARMGTHGAITLIEGVAGLIIFSLGDEFVPKTVAAKPVRMAGDGTSRIIDWGGTALIYIGFIAGSRFWWMWAVEHDLPVRGSFLERL